MKKILQLTFWFPSQIASLTCKAQKEFQVNEQAQIVFVSNTPESHGECRPIGAGQARSRPIAPYALPAADHVLRLQLRVHCRTLQGPRASRWTRCRMDAYRAGALLTSAQILYQAQALRMRPDGCEVGCAGVRKMSSKVTQSHSMEV